MSSPRETNYFPNASNATFSNFTIAHVSGSSERNGLKRLLNNISEGAFHDAAERGDPPKCHPNTRVAIRAEIMDWVDAPGARDKPIIWMYGPAGSGKTAIAQSIAEAYGRAVSFFFSRGAAGRNDTTRVVATIAYQISLHLPQIQDHLFAAIESDPTIFTRVLATQMQVLVVEPLKALPSLSQPIFVILDGLDEAGVSTQDLANAASLLKVIGTATEELQHIPLIFLIASRPEYEIREAFNGRLLSPLSRSLVLDDNYEPDEDIRLYLTSTFKEIRDKHLRQGARLPSPWPSKSDIDRLVSKASGQFIFAATVLRFIDSIRHDPVKRLDIISGLSTPGNETPFALLDALYHHILSSVAERAKVRQILTMLVLRNIVPLSVKAIEELLDLDVRRVLVDMHALIFIPPSGKNGLLRFHHASLSDFLMDQSRSHDFYINASEGHINLTRHWWKVMFNNQYSKRLNWYNCFKNFVHHCSKSPAGIGLTDDLALFDLKQLLHPKTVRHLPWKTFFDCIEKQAGDREDISRRLKAEFDSFILGCLSEYPPALQTDIATILALGLFQTSDIFRFLVCSSTKSITECDDICNLDSTLFGLAASEYSIDTDGIFATLFKDEYRAGEYYVSDRRNLALAHRIIGTIFPKPGENNRHIKFEKDSDIFNHDKQVLYLEEGSLRLRLYNLDFQWLLYMLDEMPLDLDLATMLRERALQYDVHDTTIMERSWIQQGSLKYIQRCGIPYLKHIHPPGTNKCIICEECDGASVVVDLDWQNDPQADAAAFLLAREVDHNPNDIDEVNGAPSPALSSDPEASSVAEPPKTLKRKRGSQSPPAELRRSTRSKVEKAVS